MFPSTILQAPSSSSLQNTLLRRYTNLSGPCATLCSNKPRGVLPCSLAPHWVQVVTPRSNQEPTLPSRSTPFLSSLSHTTRPISSATRVGTIVSMPLGWYLAQGLIPLGPSSSDDEEGPCELPNGRLVCGPHGLEVCGKCCVDYSFMDDVLGRDSENEDEDADSSKSDDMPSGVRPRKGTGRIFPTKFVPPSASVTPSELFTGQRQHMRITRHVNDCTTAANANDPIQLTISQKHTPKQHRQSHHPYRRCLPRQRSTKPKGRLGFLARIRSFGRATRGLWTLREEGAVRRGCSSDQQPSGAPRCDCRLAIPILARRGVSHTGDRHRFRVRC